MPIEPLQPNTSKGVDMTEMRVRDMREVAAKASQDRQKTKLKDESEERTHESERLRQEQLKANNESKETHREKTMERQEQTELENRRMEEKKNPDSGNIINVIA